MYTLLLIIVGVTSYVVGFKAHKLSAEGHGSTDIAFSIPTLYFSTIMNAIHTAYRSVRSAVDYVSGKNADKNQEAEKPES